MTIRNFSNWLIEAISANASDAVNSIILKYLVKKLGKVQKMPGVEQFINSNGKGFGVRYFYNGTKSIRFNWTSANLSSIALASIDVWNGTTKDANYHLSFDAQTSLVKILPAIIDFLKSPALGSFYAIPADDLNEEVEYSGVLNEGTGFQDAFDDLMTFLKPGGYIDVAILSAKYGQKAYKVLTFLKSNPKTSGLFDGARKTLTFVATPEQKAALIAQKREIMIDMGAVKVTVSEGGRVEHYAPGDQEKEIESEGIEKVAYEEQLQHLDSLVKLVIRGASNALFVAGRGGTGKTQTVEDVLAKAGLRDGEGYFKNTGSASPIGIYKLLFNNKDGIILFDDSDGALADQDGRNLFKAATDTKKIRKLVWNKESKNMYDPSKEPESEDEDDTRIPKWFEFTGKIIFISNLAIDKLDPDKALRTRALMIDIDPTDQEMIDYMQRIMMKIRLEDGLTLDEAGRQEVIDTIRASKNKKEISLRKLVRGLNVRAALGNDPNWKKIVQLYA